MLVLVLLIAAGWTGVWFYASREANNRFDLFLADETARGREWTCHDRFGGGYPFRVEIGCTAIEGTITDPEGRRYKIAAGRFELLAQAYELGRVIARLDGPFNLAAGDGDMLIRGDWRSLRASAHARPRRIDQIDVVARGVTGDAPGLAGFPGQTNKFAADTLEMHARIRERHGETGDIDLAASGEGILFAPEGNAPPPFSLEMNGLARNAPLRRTGDPLAFFAGAGGALDIERLKLVQNGSMIYLRGSLRLDDQMRPEGDLRLAAGGGDLRTPGAEGAFGGILPIVAMALRFAGQPTEIDGEPASAADLTIRGGEVRLGPITLGTVPALR